MTLPLSLPPLFCRAAPYTLQHAAAKSRAENESAQRTKFVGELLVEVQDKRAESTALRNQRDAAQESAAEYRGLLAATTPLEEERRRALLRSRAL